MKKLDKWVLSWLQIKTIIILKCHFLLFYTPTLNHFSTGFLHATKCGFSMTIGDDQFSGWTKKKLHSTSQSQICTKKRSWSLCGGLLPMGTTTAFWIPAKPLHLRSMLSKSMRCAENCHTCSSIGQQKGPSSSPWWCPTARCTTNTSKAERNCTAKLCLICHFPWPLANWLLLLQASWQLFAGKTFSQPARGRKYFPRVCRILLKHGFLCNRNKQTYFSLAKMCWL